MKNKGFTLIEIMIAILIVSIIMIGGFSALSAVTIGKVRLVEKTNIEKEAFYFSEKLFELIKKGGVLDYEEYWNRNMVNRNKSQLYSSGHFLHETGFGNEGPPSFGGEFYYCVSDNNQFMGTDGCSTGYNVLSNSEVVSTNRDISGEVQRFGQYALQFIDFNHNLDADPGNNPGPGITDLPGDEDNDGNIIGDDDDEYLGEGPEVFISGDDVTELYLISGDKKNRTYFRWKVENDPDSPTGAVCNFGNGQSPTGSGCLGTIQFLQLEARDWGLDHIDANNDTDGTEYDGIIDTWIIAEKFKRDIDVDDIVAGSNSYDYWQDLFPQTINVSDFKVFAYPNKDKSLAWKESGADVNLAPYIRLSLKLTPSWKKRKLIQGTIPELDLSTTISLTDLYSK